MAIPGQRSNGFTLLEMVVVVCLVALLFVLALDRLMGMRAQAEVVAVERIIADLRTALVLQLTADVGRGGLATLNQLVDSNPMDLLLVKPANYMGSKEKVSPAEIPPGNWYFDVGQQALIYRVEHESEFHSELPGPARIRTKVLLAWDDRDNNGLYDSGREAVFGLTLRGLEPVNWMGRRLL